MTEPVQNARLPFLHPTTLERPVLLERLAFARQHRLTLIAAPPGYGKTTLVAQFARQTHLPVAWHTVEENERDMPQLLAHCLAALSEIVDDGQTPKLSSAATATEAAHIIGDWLLTAVSGELIYVMDDVHHLLGSPRAEKWLRAFVEAAPPTCHILLVGRSLPPLPLTEMVAHGDVLAIGQEQLRFTFDEVQTLSTQLRMNLSAAEIQKVTGRFDGWPAGTVLALQPLPPVAEAALFAGGHGPEALFDALADHLLQTEGDSLQDFLMAASTLVRVTPVLCQTALGLSQSAAFITATLTRRLFVSQTPGGFTYHPLFRDFLQRRLESRDPVRFSELHQKAGHWFKENNRLEEAFEQYVAARCWPQAMAIAEQAAQDYAAQGKIETILHWSNQLGEVRIDCPQVIYACATIHIDRYAHDTALEELATARQGYERQHNDLGLLKVELLQASVHNLRGDYQEAIRQVGAITQNRVIPDNFRAFALYILGTGQLNLGNLDEALQHLNSALPLYRAAGDAAALAEFLLTLEQASMRVGHFDAATAFLQEVVDIRRAFENPVGLINPLNNLGYDYHLLGDYAQALRTLEEGLTVSSRFGERREESYLLWSMADLQRDLFNYDEAASLYHQALRYAHTNEPALRCAVLLGLATLQRWQGHLEAALETTREAHSLAEKHGLRLEQTEARLSFCAVKTQQGQVSAARQELLQLASALRQQQVLPQWAKALALSAGCWLLEGHAADTRQTLKAIVEGVGHEAHLQPCIAEIAHTPVLRAFVQEHSQRYPALQAGIQRLEAAMTTVPSEVPVLAKTEANSTFGLRVSILGRSNIERDSVRVRVSAWRAAAARELFFYLLFKGPSTREQIGLVLWPENSTRQVTQKFHMTLHRARNAIGTNAICFEDDLYFLSPEIDLWCDAVEFGTLVREARLSSPLRPHTESLWRRAVTLYQGELLPGVDANWLISQREALQQMYLESLFALGNCVRLRGGVQEAITIYQRALEVDPYREDLHRAVLECYAARGERSLIVRYFEQLTHFFESELGVLPSLETRTMAQALLN